MAKVTKQLEAEPIISINEARKILGKEASEMSDKDIHNLITAYDDIATLIIKNYPILNTSDSES